MGNDNLAELKQRLGDLSATGIIPSDDINDQKARLERQIAALEGKINRQQERQLLEGKMRENYENGVARKENDAINFDINLHDPLGAFKEAFASMFGRRSNCYYY
jgi:hypothetical protein